MTTKGLLGIEGLERAEIESVLERARFFQPAPRETFKRVETLKGRSVVNLFFEASTRTRVSFEIAARRLGAVVLWALVMPAALIPSAKPCWLATGPLKSAGLGSGKKSTVPPVKPKRASLTSRLVKVERRAVTFEKRFEIWLPRFGKPGNWG